MNVARLVMLCRRMSGPRPRWFLKMVGVIWIAQACSLNPPPLKDCNPQIQAFRDLTAASTALDSGNARKAMIACVNALDSGDVAAAVKAAEPEGMRLAKLFLDIPEYHDEGRLLAGQDPDGLVFLGPRAAIFASPFLKGFTRPSQIYEQGMPGMLAAMVFVELDEGEVLPQTYKNLRLQEGMNCIWLFALGPASKQFRAFVSHPEPDSACNHQKVDTQVWLPVVPVHQSAFKADSSYPPVARFDTDVSGKQPVLAFRCLDAFCEVGPPGFNVRAPLGAQPDPTGLPTWQVAGTIEEQRVRSIKGWHDEQTLAYQDAKFKWRPSQVHAMISPDPKAAALDSGDFFRKWRRVATITLDADPPIESKYFKWGLRADSNQVWLQQTAEMKWVVRIVPTKGISRTWTNTIRTGHHDVTVPATARFRWTGIDEGIWVPCGQACCRSDGGSEG